MGSHVPHDQNTVTLRDEAQFFTLGEQKVKHLLTDTSPRTAVEDGNGHFPAVHAKHQCTRLNSTQALAAIFKECLLPSQLQQPTREAYYSAWRAVVTWGVAHEEVKALLPMSQDTLRAITQEMLTNETPDCGPGPRTPARTQHGTSVSQNLKSAGRRVV
jgi:hypothetical protein